MVSQFIDDLRRLHKGFGVIEEDVFVADGDDVVMKHAGIDGSGAGLGKEGGFDLVQAGDGLGGLK